MTDEERSYEDKGGWVDAPYFRVKRGDSETEPDQSAH